MQRGDIYIINSKFKTLETVKVNDIKGDQVEVEIIDGTPMYIGDNVTLSLSKSDFAAFVFNDYQPTFRERLVKRFLNVVYSVRLDYVVILALLASIAYEATH